MKKSVRTLLTGLLALVFLFSTAQLWQQRREKAAGSDVYSEALVLATLEKAEVHLPKVVSSPEAPVPAAEPKWVVAPVEDDPHVNTLAQLNPEALRQVNPDVIGWIWIPDTVINYPLMQGSDNDYYLNNTWDGNENIVGSIFMEHLNSADFTDFNTVIYGHRMNDGSMFASLLEYQSMEYWQTHPYIYIRHDLGIYRYEIFSAYLAQVGSNTYALGFSGEDARADYVSDAILNSEIGTGIVPAATDRILTLSTCKGGADTRWVVHARLKMVLELENV